MKPPFFERGFERAPRSLLVLSLALALLGSVLAVVVIVRDDAAPDARPVKVEVGKPPTTTIPPDELDMPPDSAADPLTQVAGVATTNGGSGAGVVGPAGGSSAGGSGSGGGGAPGGATTTMPGPTPGTTTPPPGTTPPPENVAYPTGPGDPLQLGQLYVVEVAGAVAHSLAAHRDLLDRAEWAPDGRRLLYGIASPLEYETFTVKPDGSSKASLSGGGIEGPTWSSRGDLARVEYDGQGHNLRINPATGGVHRITHHQVGPVTGRGWSPDGSRLAVIAGGRVWTAKPDGTDLRALTAEGGKAWKWMQWSPDGTRVAFYEAGHMWVVNADGTNLIQLAPANADPGLSWSPDGKELAVVGLFSATPKLPIQIVSANGGPVRSLGVSGVEVSWSPDGKTIAYTSWPRVNNTHPLGLISPEGTNQRTLLTPPPQVYFGIGIEWSPDSTHLLVNTGRAGDGGSPEPF